MINNRPITPHGARGRFTLCRAAFCARRLLSRVNHPSRTRFARSVLSGCGNRRINHRYARYVQGRRSHVKEARMEQLLSNKGATRWDGRYISPDHARPRADRDTSSSSCRSSMSTHPPGSFKSRRMLRNELARR